LIGEFTIFGGPGKLPRAKNKFFNLNNDLHDHLKKGLPGISAEVIIPGAVRGSPFTAATSVSPVYLPVIVPC
jgi:hypothetical protein